MKKIYIDTIRKNRLSFGIGVVLMSLISPFLDLLGNIVRQTFFDKYAEQRPMMVYAAMLVGVCVLSAVTAYLSDRLSSVFFSDFELQVRKEVFTKIPDAEQQRDIILQLHQKLDSLEVYIKSNIVIIFNAAALVVSLLYTTFAISWMFTLLVILMTPIFALVQTSLGSLEEKSLQIINSGEKINNYLKSSVKSIDVVKVYGLQPKLIEQFSLLCEAYQSKQTSLIKAQITMKFIEVGNLILMSCLFPLFSSVLVHWGKADYGSIFVASWLFTSIMSNIGAILEMLQSRAEAKMVYQQINQLAEALPQKGESAHIVQNPESAVVLRNVSFGYGSNNEVLRNINLNIPIGAKVAIVGRSGSGKSTLLKVIAGLHTGFAGEVKVFGTPISRCVAKNLISYAGQTSQMFPVSIKENIEYGGSLTKDESERYIEALGIDQIVSSQPNGWDTIVNSNNSNLSGGQLQLLSVTRAFRKEACLLLLDEATASQNKSNAERIQKQILREPTTVIQVTHNIEHCRYADIVVLMVNGSLACYGKHEDLMNNSQYRDYILAESEVGR